ncbi:ParB N-terminal domain-containing protein [Leptospira sanjuanensis]|uniref:chromosome partitioning protein ParB n=1 Tax=Leptospira sanjuanensis TaxID=2879643 RepID=UPI001EE971DF|nr:chromosome partitioning protein ParB [Leptospira sanjuanensis]MCG6167195.1 chromosome partitioning protein ParB [Leptospira sanjuanensis]MCG6167207.1 chromosome partitioning protein ParB [Leptospira sanjuanensis]
MEEQEASPRPGSSNTKTYIPKGVSLNPIVKMVKPESLKPNPNNDFEPLSEEEYLSLKENIALNGILDALTAKKDGMLVTGENRYRIALELKEHEDENVRRRVESIPVRYYMNELTQEEEYDILEGDNLFRRHLTPEQRKERLKKRILRKYKDELVLDNRGGDRKSKSSKISSEEGTSLTGNNSEGSEYRPDILKENTNEKSKVQGELLIVNTVKDLAKKVSEKENIPVGTAKKYISEIRKEFKDKDQPSTKKEKKEETDKKTQKQIVETKAKAFQKKYSKMSRSQKKEAVNRLLNALVNVRKKTSKLNEQISELERKDYEIVTQITAVGEKERIWKLKV